MDIKDTVGNITTWVKAHPYAAAAILGGVILVAWYVSKNAGSGSDGFEISAPGERQETPLDAGGGSVGAGMGGGLAGLMDQLGQSASQQSPSPITSSPSFTTGEMWEGIQEIPSLADSFGLPPGIDSPVLVGDGGALARAGYTVPNTTIMPGGRVASNAILQPAASSGARPAARLTHPKKPKLPTSSGGKTPAMLVGKGRHFTGYHNGIYYVNGYPVSSPQNMNGVSTVILPGGRAASTQVLGLQNNIASGVTGGAGGIRRPR